MGRIRLASNRLRTVAGGGPFDGGTNFIGRVRFDRGLRFALVRLAESLSGFLDAGAESTQFSS